jgi:hypothetical protein
MNAKLDQKVTTTNGMLQAITLQAIFERAGIRVQIVSSKNGGYLDLLTTASQVRDARRLLNPEQRSGEIFCVPAGI